MAGAARDERRDYRLNFEETELCLGLPGGNGGSEAEAVKSGGGKRGFSETVDLKLNLSMKDDEREKMKAKMKGFPGSSDSAKPPSKAQVVGWPPVKSFRKNTMSVQKNSSDEDKQASSSSNAAFVKVSMDGAPYLRKVDLRMYKSYQELSGAIGKMFSSFTVGNCGSNSKATKEDLTNESKLIDLLNGSEYVSTYEDKDGDWMLVGDLPWKMFVDSCKCIRIMKGSEAIGLAPRAIENCKNRS